ncbi:MAG TPA: EAL domain-containing response regulator [Acidimicrobiales bacterium]|nr:EAL domain-containing response regulator [Acidimicrobiales bacterium]
MSTHVRTDRVLASAVPTHESVFDNAVVLVVDDHEANLVLLERILVNAGTRHVHRTSDPEAVVELYRRLRPDLVLLDLHMPGMDGLTVMDAMRDATPADDFVPVIVLTADATSMAREAALRAGATDFLTKPVDAMEVTLRARNVLHTRFLHSRLQAHNAELRAEIAERDAAEREARMAASAKVRRLRAVLDVNPPRMLFQPVAQLASGKVMGYEALARFDQEPYEPPNVWFAEATKAGLGVEFELAALRIALDQLAVLPGAVLALNVSPTTAMTSDLADLLSHYPQERIVLELTEHAQVDDYDRLLESLTRLRSRGVCIAVDDAGAGFSSLHHILLLAPDIIKLDITLVRDIHKDPVKRALAWSLVTFAREIGSTIIAEGIETAEELSTLVDLGIPWGQGYHLGRPEPLPPR